MASALDLTALLKHRDAVAKEFGRVTELPDFGYNKLRGGLDEAVEFRVFHNSASLNAFHIIVASKIKIATLIDALLAMIEIKNPLGIYATARSMLELTAILSQLESDLSEAYNGDSRQWIQRAQSFMAAVLTTRFAISDPDLWKGIAKQFGVTYAVLQPLKPGRAVAALSARAGFENASQRYKELCNYVHHSFSSNSTSLGESRVDKAFQLADAKLPLTSPTPIASYQYPCTYRGDEAAEKTAPEFERDVQASLNWLDTMPNTPFRDEEFAEHGVDPRVSEIIWPRIYPS